MDQEDSATSKPKQKQKKGTCRFCKETFCDKFVARRHEKRAHKDQVANKGAIKPYQSVPDQVSTQMDGHIPKEKMKNRCRFCNQTFAQSRNVRRHEKSVHKDRMTQNPSEIKSTIATKAVISVVNDTGSAEKSKDKNRSLLCRFCHQAFSRSWVARRHEQTVHKVLIEKEPFKSKTSSIVADEAAEVQENGEISKPKEAKGHCSFCKKTFYNPWTAKRHERLVHKDLLPEVAPVSEAVQSNKAAKMLLKKARRSKKPPQKQIETQENKIVDYDDFGATLSDMFGIVPSSSQGPVGTSRLLTTASPSLLSKYGGQTSKSRSRSQALKKVHTGRSSRSSVNDSTLSGGPSQPLKLSKRSVKPSKGRSLNQSMDRSLTGKKKRSNLSSARSKRSRSSPPVDQSAISDKNQFPELLQDMELSGAETAPGLPEPDPVLVTENRVGGSAEPFVEETRRDRFAKDPKTGLWPCGMCQKKFKLRTLANKHRQSKHTKKEGSVAPEKSTQRAKGDSTIKPSAATKRSKKKTPEIIENESDKTLGIFDLNTSSLGFQAVRKSTSVVETVVNELGRIDFNARKSFSEAHARNVSATDNSLVLPAVSESGLFQVVSPPVTSSQLAQQEKSADVDVNANAALEDTIEYRLGTAPTANDQSFVCAMDTCRKQFKTQRAVSAHYQQIHIDKSCGSLNSSTSSEAPLQSAHGADTVDPNPSEKPSLAVNARVKELQQAAQTTPAAALSTPKTWSSWKPIARRPTTSESNSPKPSAAKSPQVQPEVQPVTSQESVETSSSAENNLTLEMVRQRQLAKESRTILKYSAKKKRASLVASRRTNLSRSVARHKRVQALKRANQHQRKRKASPNDQPESRMQLKKDASPLFRKPANSQRKKKSSLEKPSNQETETFKAPPPVVQEPANQETEGDEAPPPPSPMPKSNGFNSNQCEYCGEQFKAKKALATHELNNHPAPVALQRDYSTESMKSQKSDPNVLRKIRRRKRSRRFRFSVSKRSSRKSLQQSYSQDDGSAASGASRGHLTTRSRSLSQFISNKQGSRKFDRRSAVESSSSQSVVRENRISGRTRSQSMPRSVAGSVSGLEEQTQPSVSITNLTEGESAAPIIPASVQQIELDNRDPLVRESENVPRGIETKDPLEKEAEQVIREIERRRDPLEEEAESIMREMQESQNQSEKLLCRYCHKSYQRAYNLTKHESMCTKKTDSVSDSLSNQQKIPDEQTSAAKPAEMSGVAAGRKMPKKEKFERIGENTQTNLAEDVSVSSVGQLPDDSVAQTTESELLLGKMERQLGIMEHQARSPAQQSQSSGRTLFCPKCSKSFRNGGNLTRHKTACMKRRRNSSFDVAEASEPSLVNARDAFSTSGAVVPLVADTDQSHQKTAHLNHSDHSAIPSVNNESYEPQDAALNRMSLCSATQGLEMEKEDDLQVIQVVPAATAGPMFDPLSIKKELQMSTVCDLCNGEFKNRGFHSHRRKCIQGHLNAKEIEQDRAAEVLEKNLIGPEIQLETDNSSNAVPVEPIAITVDGGLLLEDPPVTSGVGMGAKTKQMCQDCGKTFASVKACCGHRRHCKGLYVVASEHVQDHRPLESSLEPVIVSANAVDKDHVENSINDVNSQSTADKPGKTCRFCDHKCRTVDGTRKHEKNKHAEELRLLQETREALKLVASSADVAANGTDVNVVQSSSTLAVEEAPVIIEEPHGSETQTEDNWTELLLEDDTGGVQDEELVLDNSGRDGDEIAFLEYAYRRVASPKSGEYFERLLSEQVRMARLKRKALVENRDSAAKRRRLSKQDEIPDASPVLFSGDRSLVVDNSCIGDSFDVSSLPVNLPKCFLTPQLQQELSAPARLAEVPDQAIALVPPPVNSVPLAEVVASAEEDVLQLVNDTLLPTAASYQEGDQLTDDQSLQNGNEPELEEYRANPIEQEKSGEGPEFAQDTKDSTQDTNSNADALTKMVLKSGLKSAGSATTSKKSVPKHLVLPTFNDSMLSEIYGPIALERNQRKGQKSTGWLERGDQELSNESSLASVSGKLTELEAEENTEAGPP